MSERGASLIVFSLLVFAGGGCSFIDDFDRFAFQDGGGAEDAAAGDDAGRADGGEGPDGGLDAGVVDGGADAGLPDCAAAAGCLGDLAEDYGETQPSAALGWRYLVDDRSDPGFRSQSPLVFANGGWAPSDAAEPLIRECANPAVCGAPLEGTIAVEVTPATMEDGRDALVAFDAPETGTLRIPYEVRSASDLGVELVALRNTREDVAALAELTATVAGVSGELSFPVIEGDRVALRLRGTGGGPGRVGLSAQVNDAGEASTCLMALSFDAPDPGAGSCQGRTLDIAGGSQVTSMSPRFGSAADFSGSGTDTYDLEGAPLDYSSDFTVQMWVRPNDVPGVFRAVYSDRSDNGDGGGASLGFSSFGVAAETVYPATACPDGMLQGGFCFLLLLDRDAPPVDEWHHYRIVRDTSADAFRLCVDGVEVGSVPLDGDLDLRSDVGPRLGAQRVFTAMPMSGQVDDVRVWSAALPCL